MNIIQALVRSKETGERFRRPCWDSVETQFYQETMLSHLSGADLLADDWEPVPQSHDLLPPSAAKSADTEAMLLSGVDPAGGESSTVVWSLCPCGAKTIISAIVDRCPKCGRVYSLKDSDVKPDIIIGDTDF